MKDAEKRMAERRKTSCFLIAAAGILILAALLRVLAFSPGLEYDEIWTMRNYSARDLWTILNDLATPNNHPLNSLFVKWMLFFSETAWSIRFPSFLAGTAAVGLTGYLAFLLFRSRLAALAAMLPVAANPALILYSITARGYAVQTMLILVYAIAVVCCYRNRGGWGLRAIPVCGVLAELALPTSVLWLFPISLAHCVAELRRVTKRNWKSLIPLGVSYSILAVILLVWILLHYNDFRAGQSFGSAVAGIVPFFREFLFPSLAALCGWTKYGCGVFLLLTALWMIPVRKSRRVQMGMVLFGVFFPFFGAVITLAGPPRVYLPSLPLIALAAGGMLASAAGMIRKISRNGLSIRFCRYAVLIAAALLAAGSYGAGRRHWTRVDWIDRFKAIREIPADHFLCISATGGYPALWNNGTEAVQDYLIRFRAVAPGTRFVQVDQKGVVNGMNPQGGEDTIPLAGRKGAFSEQGGMLLYSYRLTPWDGTAVPECVLLRLEGIPPRYYTDLISALAQTPFAAKVLILNAFFVNAAQQATPDRRINALIALQIRKDLPGHALFRRFHAANRGKFDFFTLSGESE